jgi:hypothetical protein
MRSAYPGVAIPQGSAPGMVQYGKLQPLQQFIPSPFREPTLQSAASNRSSFRLEVQNIPQYLQNDEFKNQFLRCEGCVDAVVGKDETGYDAVDDQPLPPYAFQGKSETFSLYRMFTVYFIDFDTQENAEKCVVAFNGWKGWGPKGLSFKRAGFVSLPSDMKRSGVFH